MFALFNRPQYLRIIFVMLLILFAGSKVAAPVYKVFKAVYKEASAAASSEEDSTEQPAQKDIISGKPYFLYGHQDGVYTHTSNGKTIIHVTEYAENFLAGHVREISSPPPDRA